MSQRSTVFLDEMGVGVQWKLRNPASGEEAGGQQETVESVVEVVAEAAPAFVPAPAPAPVIAAAPVAAPVAAPTPAPAVAMQPPVAAPAPSFAPEQPLADEPAAAMDDDSTAWFDEAPVPARAAPVSDEAIAAMDWTALKTAVSTCTRCSLCDVRRNAVNGRGAADATWLAIAAAPSRLDEKENQAITGEAGQLLDNMLKAIALKPETDVYVTNLVKCRPVADDGADRAPTGEELLACRPFLDRELALTGATMAMTFGQYAAKGLMMGPAARGKVMRYGAAELPVVATYHPDDLLRRPEDKAKAWGDLCLAKAARD
ncbi:uracil-DNA glycosylase [Rugamonas aquatica]|uniref:Uracil-DNA glycosylase n=1 Tax=Rugamonas aquatica TaxID=2743357 RepID=A0A6A7N1J4_9BURK|nr:uracil-DNA glycosylase [Rugamonas aquatica]MQA38944.1 uracil-DNA glycosylase [Rugamonas aquatica]